MVNKAQTGYFPTAHLQISGRNRYSNYISVVGVSPVFNDTQCGYPAEFDTGETFFSPRVKSFSIFFPTTSYHIRALFSAPNLGVIWGSGPKSPAESGLFFNGRVPKLTYKSLISRAEHKRTERGCAKNYQGTV